MSGSITLLIGSHAQECAAVLKACDGVAIAANAFSVYPYFAPMRPVLIFGPCLDDVAPWLRRATAILQADDRSAAQIVRGRFRGRGRGKEIRWGKR